VTKNKLENGKEHKDLFMKKISIIIVLSILFIGCSDKKGKQVEEKKELSNVPILGDEKQTGKW